MADKIFNTDLRGKITVDESFETHLQLVNRSLNNFATDLRLKTTEENIFSTDLRVTYKPYESVTPKSLNDIVVKKDGAELSDVDYKTLKITYSLNSTPSSATFVLARYHDKLDFTINNVSSEITNENKIQIYDGTILLFTGYITQIQADSSQELVTVTAEDLRYKLKKQSMKLAYGGKAVTANNTDTVDEYGDLPSDPVQGEAYIVKSNNHLYIYINSAWSDRGNVDYLDWTQQIVSISTKTALETVFTYVASIISGYDSIYFGFIPEYTDDYNDCASLIDNLVQNSANVNWYVDENEYIRFQKVANGIIKYLSLSGVTAKRHLYDVVVNSVTINKKTSEYVTAYDVRFGKKQVQTWYRSSEHPNLDLLPTDYVRELTWFGFQKSNTNSLYGTNLIYVGEGVTSISGYENEYFYIRGYFIYQWLAEDYSEEIPAVVIGSGTTKKTVYYNSYGIVSSNLKWEEKTFLDGSVYLYSIREEQIDNRAYALDAAYFDLSQNNLELTEANVTIILDAYEFYQIGLKDRINITNTLTADIYNNSNGFPLNLQSVTIDCSTRLVTLSLTNYGKTYRQRSGNILLSYLPKYQHQMYLKRTALDVGSGL